MDEGIIFAQLMGVVKLFDDTFTFALPVFSSPYSGTSFLVQEVTSAGTIACFARAEIESKAFYPVSVLRERRLGDPALVAFEVTEGEFYVEERRELVSLLRHLLHNKALETRPFTRSAIALFCGETQVATEADIQAILKLPTGGSSQTYYRINVLVRDNIKEAFLRYSGPGVNLPKFQLIESERGLKIELSPGVSNEDKTIMEACIADCAGALAKLAGLPDSQWECTVSVKPETTKTEERIESRRELEYPLALLTGDDRDVVALALDGMDIDEIANVFEISRREARERWFRGLEALREGLQAVEKAGREMMIGGICEYPMTYRAIIAWRDAMNEGKMLLRDIIDLDATYGSGVFGPVPTEIVAVVPEGGSTEGEAGGEGGEVTQNGADPSANGDAGNGEDVAKELAEIESELAVEEAEGEESSISLAAMEAQLKPSALATFDAIAETYKRLHRLQDQRINALQKGEPLPRVTERRYEKLKAEIVDNIKRVRLNNTRIEYLVDQLYDVNRRLVSDEGRLLRLAESAGVKHSEFLQQYFGSELAADWLERVQALPGRGWARLIEKHGAKVAKLRSNIGHIAAETKLPISEFRRVVQTVQRGDLEARRAKKEMIEANLRLSSRQLSQRFRDE